MSSSSQIPPAHDARISLPGFGMDLRARKYVEDAFPIALFLSNPEAPTLTVREYTMMELMNRLTDKPGWNQKVFDEGIVNRWRVETLTAREANVDISSKMFEWCIAELRYKAKIFDEIHCVETLDGVWKSDTLVPEALKKELQEAVAPLEDVPETAKDWHPGSNEQVLDLIHPSIYPLVYGQSRVLAGETCGLGDCMTRIGQGQIIPVFLDDLGTDTEWSNTFQWLPADFDTPPGTEDVKITSYINNLHPDRHQSLYALVAKIVAKAIPLWNRTLGPHINVPPRVWFNRTFTGYADGEEEPYQQRGESDEVFEARYEAWRAQREIVQPEPGDFEAPAKRRQDRFPYGAPTSIVHDLKPGVDLRKDFGKLQIIVKLASIHLTPEKPEYAGGSWHVEGQANETICTTALYYYDCENISESLLAFRQQVDDGSALEYAQDDHRAIETIYGFQNGEAAVQKLGKVVAREGRLLAFPNTMQHRVTPFRLADPTKPGHRKILALFLVDPHLRIISTANVPPQQKDWWEEMVETTGALGKMPRELSDHIVGLADFPVSLKETREQRLALMGERTKFVAEFNEGLLDNFFSLCEH